MKTSDEHLNEALSLALKRKLGTFETEPDPLAFGYIRTQLPARRNWKWAFLALSIFILGLTGVLVNRQQRFEAAKSANVVLGKVNRKAVSVKKEYNTQGVQSHHVIRSNQPIKQSTATKTIAVRTEVFNISALKTGQHDLHENRTTDAEHIDLTKEENAIHIPQVEMLESAQLTFGSLALPEPNADANPVVPRVNALEKSKIKWLFNAAVLEGYQILTVPAAAAHSYQNFELPRPFSLQSAGVKLGVGVEKNGFQFKINYNHLRQRYAYEIAGEEFIVEDKSEAGFHIVRPGERVEFDQQLDLLGIGISKQVQWGRSAVSRYFATAGIEYTRGLDNSQQLGFVNAAVGKQFLLSRKLAAEIGPFAEVSPFRVQSKGTPFYSQPYRVGINLGVRLVK